MSIFQSVSSVEQASLYQDIFSHNHPEDDIKAAPLLTQSPIDEEMSHIDKNIEALRIKIGELKMQMADEPNFNLRFEILKEIKDLENQEYLLYLQYQAHKSSQKKIAVVNKLK